MASWLRSRAKTGAVCPFCDTRRMVETAAQTGDHVPPPMALRN